MKLVLNITAEDGELLTVISTLVFLDTERPLGTTGYTLSLIHDIEDAARILVNRKLYVQP